jgi:parallel beta-helix repeat protein
MDNCASKRQLLILDCCHSGAFRRGITKATVGQPVETSQRFAGEGRIVLAASDATQYAYDGDDLEGAGKPSLFTRYLIEGLASGAADADRNGEITVDELYLYAHDRVSADQPDQTPIKSNYNQRGAFVIAQSRYRDSAPIPAPTLRYRTLLVDQSGGGNYTTISEAVAAARRGDHIRIKPGTYQESFVIYKALEIVGEGTPGAVIIESAETHVIRFSTDTGSIRNLTLRQLGSSDGHCIDIGQGQLTIEDYDISSQSGACVAIHGGANPTLRANHIHDGEKGGVFVFDKGSGLIENNEIYNNRYGGVWIKTGASPHVRNNFIYNGRQAGVWVTEHGAGLIEDNDIYGNVNAGVEIRAGGRPTVHGNHIYDGKSSGVLIHTNGAGIIESNDIAGNVGNGISIATGASPTIRNNRVHDGKSIGIRVHEQGAGLIENNDIYANAYAGIEIRTGSSPIVRGNRIYRGRTAGILVSDNGLGLLENNDIYANVHVGIEIKTGGSPNVHNNRIYDGKSAGAYIHNSGAGLLENNDIYDNARAGIVIMTIETSGKSRTVPKVLGFCMLLARAVQYV